MMPAEALDDVIHIRVDADAAVRAFLALLAEQAAAGETRAPAKPANRAVFRELAPYRLVEYSYVDEGVGAIAGIYLGFPAGTIYSVSDDIPEDEVDSLVAADPVPPVYVHVVLAAAQPAERIDHFLGQLAHHMGSGVVGLVGAEGRAYEGVAHEGGGGAPLKAAAAKCAVDAAQLPDKAQLLARLAARSESADGRAYAQLTHDFAKHLLEFSSVALRDRFIQWTRTLCDFGFADVPRPAEPAAPCGELVAVALDAPDCAADSPDQAQAYWNYVIATVAAAERG